MFEQESGQVLIDRRRHAAALELVHFYAFHQPNHFKRLNVAYGDKDLFRFAWLKLGANFHMIQAPPAVAGKVTSDSFCGMTMVQHDAHGEVLFLHRNSHKLTGEAKRAYVNVRESAKQRAAEKLRQQDPDGRIYPTGKEIDAEIDTGTPAPTLWAPEPDGYPDAAIWTHLLSFRNTSDRAQYVIKGFHASPEFPKWQNCYGQRYIGSNPNFYAQEVASTNFAGLETHLRRFAAKAAQLLSGTYDDGSFTP
ncbi:Kinesin protein [Phytophthora cinnamomi]|nr:Kinesin protein [Phytophthora cinnamomi]